MIPRNRMFELFLTLLVSSACGKSGTTSVSPDGSAAFYGDIQVGTQCPFGTISKTIPAGFTLRSCQLSKKELHLQQPPGPLYLSGDCTEKILAVRSSDGTVDTLWQVQPNGSFSLFIDGFYGKFESDQAGHTPCLSKMNLELDGKLDCRSRDSFKIFISTMRFWLTTPSEEEIKAAGTASCQLPESCHLETKLELQQCW